MQKWILFFIIIFSSLTAFAYEVTPGDSLFDGGTLPQEALEKEDESNKKFSHLVRSTMELMGPTEESTISQSSTITP